MSNTSNIDNVDRWDWEREFEDAFSYSTGHYTRSLDSVLICYGEGDDDYWRMEGISDEDAKKIAAVPEMIAVLKKVVGDGYTAGYTAGAGGQRQPCRYCRYCGYKQGHTLHCVLGDVEELLKRILA